MELLVFFIVFFLFLLGGLTGVCLAILHLSKYPELEKYYAVQAHRKIPLQRAYARLNFITFNRTFKLALEPEGLYLSISRVFRFKHAALLLVPWVDAQIQAVDFHAGLRRIKIAIGPEEHKLTLYGEEIYAALKKLA